MSAFNGSGTFVISGVGLPYVTATVISSTVANQLNTDLATGLSNCLTKDGQTVPVANIPMGGFRLTGLGAPVAPGDALVWGQPATVSSPFDITKNQNASTLLTIHNNDLGTGAATGINLINAVGDGKLLHFGQNYTPTGVIRADGTALLGNGAGGLTVATTQPRILYFGINNAVKMQLDTNGNLGIGRLPEPIGAANIGVALGTAALVVGNVGTQGLALSSNSYNNGGSNVAVVTGPSSLFGMQNGEYDFYSAISAAAGTPLNYALRMQSGATGVFAAGTDDSGVIFSNNYAQLCCKRSSTAGDASVLLGNNGTISSGVFINNGDGAQGSSSSCVMRMPLVQGNGRSINAGGTFNANGTDYAEYYLKRLDCSDIPKGALAGIDAQGKLTDQWVRAASFKFKSTSPSFVGGDVWGTDSISHLPGYDNKIPSTDLPQAILDALEVARLSVDRMVCTGKVPAILVGAFAAGDLVVPVQNGVGIVAAAVPVTLATMTDLAMKIGRVQVANPTAADWARLLGLTFPIDPAWNAIVDV